jgi:tripartite-type tricarboxylate transporter receptor subunit TctC
LFAAVLAAAASGGAVAAAWPARQVDLVVPFSAGGGVDNVARVLAAGLAKELKQSVVVENRTGAGGLIGGKYVADAAPDGYTLLMGTQTTLAVAPLLHPDAGLDPLKAYAGISKVGSSPLLLVANPGFPAKTVRELVALAKKEPGKINYGSGGVGTTPHMAMALLALDAGIRMTHVPYKGEQPALTDTIGNQISLMFSNLPVSLPLVRSGRLRALAVSSAARVPTAPDIPTVAESGIAGFEAGTWFAVVAPKGTPPDVVQTLNRAIGRALGDSKLRSTLQGQGVTVQAGSAQDLDNYIGSEYQKWARVVKAAHIKVK